MTWWLLIPPLAVTAAVVFAWSLCVGAATGDRLIDEARRRDAQ